MERFTKIPTSLRKKGANFHILFPSKKCFSCYSVIVSTSLAPVFFSFFLTPPPSPPTLFTVDLHCGPETGVGSYCCCRERRGGFPTSFSLSLSLAESKHLCVAAGDVMALKPLKKLFPGKPHIRKSRRFFSLSPLSLIVIAEQLWRRM